MDFRKYSSLDLLVRASILLARRLDDNERSQRTLECAMLCRRVLPLGQHKR